MSEGRKLGEASLLPRASMRAIEVLTWSAASRLVVLVSSVLE